MRCGAFHRVEGTLCLVRHGQAALSGSKTKAPGFAGGYLLRFRHVISGSLALASLNHTCRNLVPTFPQRSPPSLLTTAACGGLRSAPDCRPRRTYLHLSYSYAPPCGPALLVTQDPSATLAVHCGNGFDARFESSCPNVGAAALEAPRSPNSRRCPL